MDDRHLGGSGKSGDGNPGDLTSEAVPQVAHPPAVRQIRPHDAPHPSRSAVGGDGMRALDHLLHAWQARFTGGLSPTGIALAWWDWLLHLANSPAKQAALAEGALAGLTELFGTEGDDLSAPRRMSDHRFGGPHWREAPFAVLARSYLLTERWLCQATTDVPGVRQRHERLVSFLARQWLDAVSPVNFPFSNPDVVQRSLRDGGLNFLLGAMNLAEDLGRRAMPGEDSPAPSYRVGVDIAATPGKIVYRNRLMELIQYAPVTPQVAREPVLLVPAWIMKYYILDLSDGNSLVRFLVDRGFTVFAISWRNPGPEERDIGLDDYRELGVMAALDAIGAIMPEQRVHAAGYCLGGTLLAIAAAEMAREDDDRLAGVTLLTAQLDFTEAGELLTFISEDQIAFIEDEMWLRGYLDAGHMSGAFQALRAGELVWGQAVRHYLLGERDGATDLMAWNRDATRMPYRMQTEYLRQLFLGNDLARGRFLVDKRPVVLSDITAPIFAVATERDHIAPWRSVFKIGLLTHGELTFVLTAGGHNGGVVSEPGHPGRRYRIHARPAGAGSIDAERWLDQAERREGSWWEAWVAWLEARSGGRIAAPTEAGAAAEGYPVLGDAPGSYVHMR